MKMPQPNRLFQEPISAFVEQRLGEAKTHAEQLTPQQLEASDIAETLQKIAKFKFNLATLKPDQRKGKRRTEKRKVMDYGREVIVDVDLIDVEIPFEGWPKSLYLAPSSRTLIDIPTTITSNNTIKVSFPDDENLDRNVDFFIQNVTANLNTLEKELQRIEPQMLQVAQTIVTQRIEQIRERKNRDKGRSFPIE
jgi:hypothetical protein